jgi:RNA polymerase sigma factor FliA
MLKNGGSPGKYQLSQDELIKIGLPLVRRMAFRFARRLPRNVELDDLIGAGTEGLIRAIRSYEPDQYPVFEPYAKARIRGAMLDELRTSDHLTRYARDRVKEMAKVAAELQRELKRAPTEMEVASRIGISLDEYQRVSAEVEYRPMLGSAESTDPDTIESETADPSEHVERAAVRAQLTEAIAKLPEKYQQALALYYQEECTQIEIGRILGISNSRACQILNEATERLRSLIDQANRQSAPSIGRVKRSANQ